jgi:hypothetical protein
MLSDEPQDRGQVSLRETIVPGELDRRLDPELRLPRAMLDMNVSPRLLAREEEEPIRALAKDRWTHSMMIARACGGETD